MVLLLTGGVSGCSDEAQARESFELCGKTLTVVEGATAYNWGDRYGSTDGHTNYDVVPTSSMKAPDSIDQVVTGLDQFVVVDTSASQGATIRLSAANTGCVALAQLVEGDAVDDYYPSSGYPWVVNFSE